MTKVAKDIKQTVHELILRFSAWVKHPFESLYRWAIPLVVFAVLCFALPAGIGVVVFLPCAAVFILKAIGVSQRIHRLDFIELVADEGGRPELNTERDRLQRAWVLGCVSMVGLSLLLLIARALLTFFPGLGLSGEVVTYLTFTAVLLGGFLLFYFWALRFDSSLMRGMASVAVTLPAFFVIIALVGLLLSWVMRIVSALGLPAENMITDGFSWVYEMQRILGSATDYFLQQDLLIIGASIVFAAVLLLLYAYTVPYYWLKSAARWFRGLGLVAVVFSGAAIVFASVWVVDVQRWAAESESSQFAQAIDASVLSKQADALSGYHSEDLIALVKAFVLPYTVGVFIANAVVALRKGKAKSQSDAILDSFAETGIVDKAALPELERRYLYFNGNRTLWDIALRSIGNKVELPHPFAPRKLTLKERLTGELEDEKERQAASNAR